MDTLLHAALSNASVAVILASVVGLFGRFSRRPALVHSLWIVVFLKLLTPPLWPVSFSWPGRSAEAPAVTDRVMQKPSLLVASEDEVPRRGPTDQATGVTPEVSVAPAASASHSENPTAPLRPSVSSAQPLSMLDKPDPPASPPPVPAWRFWLFTVWLSGSALWLALACYRFCRFHRVLRFTQRAPASLQNRAHHLAECLGVARCPGVWVVSARISPMLWAVLGEPRVLVPASLLEHLSEEQWDTLLAHELAHLRRRDHWVRLLEMAVTGLYWWHPVVWWARRQLREVEEQCCDAWVVWALPDAAEVYATTLVEAVTYLSGARSILPLAASGIGRVHPLKRRLTMIMRGTTPRALSATGSLAVFGLAAVLLPLYPTLARTEQGADGAGHPPPATGASATRTTSAPVSAATTVEGEPYARYPSATAATGGDSNYAATIEDAQDDVELLRVQLDLRRAERREVEARVHQAQADLQRYQRLAANAGVSSDTVEHARTEVVVQEARLAAKDAQIKEAALRLKQAERRLARFHSRTVPPTKAYTPSSERPSGSAIPQQHAPGGFSGGVGFAGGGAGFSSGVAAGGGLGFPGAGVGPGGTGGGMMAGGPGVPYVGTASGASAYEHRLTEVEKKLQTLMDEMKALRKERRREQREFEPKRP